MILRAPGTNCDGETAFAFEQAGSIATRTHINQLREDRQLVRDYQILCLPGGFSYGDDIAAGAALIPTEPVAPRTVMVTASIQAASNPTDCATIRKE